MKRPGYYTSACCLGLSFFLFNSCSFLSSGGHDWPMWRYDANRSAHSPEQLPDDLQLLWVREYPRLVQTWDDPLNQDLMQYDKVYEPVVHRGILFLVSNASDCLIALDAEDGSELWRYYVDGPVRFPAVAAEGKVFFTSDDGNLYCLDAETGKAYWTYDLLAAAWGSPLIVDGKVYIGDEDGDIAVLEAGREMKLLSETNVGAAVYTTPVVKDGVMYVASRTKLFALADGIPGKAPEPAPAKAAGGSAD